MELKLTQYQIRFSWIQPDFYPLDLWVLLIVRSDRITQNCTAMVSVDNTQPVHRGIGTAQHGINRSDCLSLRHVVNVYLQKSADQDTDHPCPVL